MGRDFASLPLADGSQSEMRIFLQKNRVSGILKKVELFSKKLLTNRSFYDIVLPVPIKRDRRSYRFKFGEVLKLAEEAPLLRV